MQEEYIAHIRKDGTVQAVREHCLNVSSYTGKRGAEFEGGNVYKLQKEVSSVQQGSSY